MGELLKKKKRQRHALFLRLLTFQVDMTLMPVWQAQKTNKSGSSDRQEELHTESAYYGGE